MKAVLKFNLPEEQDEFNLALSAQKYFCTLSDLSQELRKIRKYEEHSDEVRNVVERLEAILAEVGDL